jgi:adenylate cyclase
MDERRSAVPKDDAFWRDYLTNGDRMERRVRGVLRFLPDGPRCKLCAAPFHGFGGTLMRTFGKYPSDKDPNVCNSCFAFVAKHHGGAEIQASFLFADSRGSTTIAERSTAKEFRALLDRFYRTASDVVFRNEGAVDKFVGDEVVAMFFPLMSGELHAGRAVQAARDLLRATGHAEPAGPWVPVGAGVSSGPAWIGAVGDDAHTELTALGDTVNIAARLASAAAGGEALVTAAAATSAGLDPSLPRATLELKGKLEQTEVVRITVGPPPGGAAHS